MAPTDIDYAIAILLAIFILAFMASVYPGFCRITNKDLSGYWMSSSGTMHHVQPTSTKKFEISSTGIVGKITGIRGIHLSSGTDGRLELFDRRRINWKNGNYWTRQGF